jgi:hypothetical protein
MASTHPDFADGLEVVCIKKTSAYYGQRGVVYGSGATKKDPSNTSAVIYVRWPNGARNGYLAKRLSPAPKNEIAYRISTKNKGKTKVEIHEVPASKNRPTIFEVHEGQSSQ